MNVRKYHKLNFKTYQPKSRLNIKEEAMPHVMHLGSGVAGIGGFIGTICSSFLISISGFFKAKKKIRGFIRRKEKIIDLRRSKKV